MTTVTDSKRPILVIDIRAIDSARIRMLLAEHGLLCTPEQADELASYVRPLPFEDNELFGRLVDAVQIDYETAEEDPEEHLQTLVALWESTPRDDKEAHQKIQRRMMLATNGMEEHPEKFNHSCLCDLCRSY